MPALGLFRKTGKDEDEKTATSPSEEKGVLDKTYLKAMPLRDLSDLEEIKNEVKNGNVLILRITPLASKNIEDVKRAVNELFEFAESIGGDIARLGEERVVICPQNIRIWREKRVTNKPLPTAA
ncbi:MAG: cell division protein SepF [Candidatus Bathyarchaeota archaeon]|nr:cell division protein SepF [Candidatus Bathyarchaeota archaeon]